MENDTGVSSKLDWDGALRRLSTDHKYEFRKADVRRLREYILNLERLAYPKTKPSEPI